MSNLLDWSRYLSPIDGAYRLRMDDLKRLHSTADQLEAEARTFREEAVELERSLAEMALARWSPQEIHEAMDLARSPTLRRIYGYRDEDTQ